MRLVRRVRSFGVYATLAFSLLALAVLPTALCCQVVAETDVDGHAGHSGGEPEECPHRTADGRACPLHRSPSDDAPSQDADCSELVGCAVADSLLSSLRTLTGAMPEPEMRAAVPWAARLLDPPAAPGDDLEVVDPFAPPPRSRV